jgi:putative membrane protein
MSERLTCACHAAADAAPVLSQWTADPWVISALSASSAAYAIGVARMWKRAGVGHGLSRWQAGAFGAFALVTAAALLSPLDSLSDLLFSAHMSQHELLMLVAAPLFVLSKPLLGWMWVLPEPWRAQALSPAIRATLVRSARLITHPLVALPLHGLVLWLWHLPALFELALRNEAVHALQHLGFFGSAALFFWALFHGRYGRSGYGLGVLFVFITMVHTSLLGALLTFARSLWYPAQSAHTGLFALSGLEDQQLAGLIMWVPAGVLLMTVGLVLLVAWLGASQRVPPRR